VLRQRLGRGPLATEPRPGCDPRGTAPRASCFLPARVPIAFSSEPCHREPVVPIHDEWPFAGAAISSALGACWPLRPLPSHRRRTLSTGRICGDPPSRGPPRLAHCLGTGRSSDVRLSFGRDVTKPRAGRCGPARQSDRGSRQSPPEPSASLDSPVELAEQLGDSVQVALTTYDGLFDEEESETKLRSILEASYPVAAG
jgi:hypothetical protein